MNDNWPIKSHEWIDIIEQEWGFRPLSCRVDHDNPRIIRATFSHALKINGDMRIRGFEIVPHTFTGAALEHPFNATRTRRTRHSHNILAHN